MHIETRTQLGAESSNERQLNRSRIVPRS